MKPLVYKRESASWDWTTNPIIANSWYNQDEIVYIYDNDKLINTWMPPIK